MHRARKRPPALSSYKLLNSLSSALVLLRVARYNSCHRGAGLLWDRWRCGSNGTQLLFNQRIMDTCLPSVLEYLILIRCPRRPAEREMLTGTEV